jgi:hypothetical protein
MKSFLHIEPSAFRKGEYVGYADGLYLIHRTNSTYGNWIAHHRDNPAIPSIYAMRLSDLDAELARRSATLA